MLGPRDAKQNAPVFGRSVGQKHLFGFLVFGFERDKRFGRD
jgi:hypothetical protein